MSTLRVNTIQNSGGTGSPEINGLARAWVNFNGTGTVAIRASNNVSSITDNGVGDYSVNFVTALADTNYSVAGVASSAVTGNYPWVVKPVDSVATPLTTSYRFQVGETGTASLVDSTRVSISIFR